MGDYGVGSPNCLLLDHWALLVWPIFKETPYLVGSAATSTTWRDVDVRIIMDDEKYGAWFGDAVAMGGFKGAKWSGLMTAISLWGQKVTGLPIDFQVQRRSEVSDADWGKRRLPLGLFAMKGEIAVVVPSPGSSRGGASQAERKAPSVLVGERRPAERNTETDEESS